MDNDNNWLKEDSKSNYYESIYISMSKMDTFTENELQGQGNCHCME